MKKETKGDKKGDSKKPVSPKVKRSLEDESSKKKVKVSLFDDEKKSKSVEKISEQEEEEVSTKFLIEMGKTLALILIFGIGTFAIIRAAYSADSLRFLFYPFQYVEFNATYGISKLFGIDVVKSSVHDYTLIYTFPDGETEHIQIISACTAVCEMGMIIAVILAFRGPRFKKRIIWAFIFAGIIFVENIIRLVMNYPLFRYLGEEGWVKYHNFWMEYGQLLVVIGLLIIYVVFIANKDIMKVYSFEKHEEDEKEKKDQKPEKPSKNKKKAKGKEEKPKKGADKNGKD
jgi:exosortase/archaeosortase family protein